MIITKPSGTTQIYLGRSAPSSGAPSWTQGLAANSIGPIPGTQTFFSQATALLGSGTQWPGTNPIGSLVDAYGDPVRDGASIYFNGGGHGDGFWNGILKYDLQTLAMSVEIPAAPGSCYPVGFPNATWPSGRGVDWMRTMEQHNPEDVAFAAPFSSPRSTHEYGGQAVRNKSGVPKQIYYFYGAHKVYDFASGMWTNRHELGQDYVTQKVAVQANIVQPGLGTQINPTIPFQWGTNAIYDDVTDKYYVTFVQGDSGGGWRNFFICYDPATDTVPSIHRPATGCRSVMSWVKAGRHLYGILSPTSIPYPNYTFSIGFRYHIDNQNYEYFTVTGNVPSFNASGQESIPYLHDSTRNTLVGWSHNATDRGALYELNLSTFGMHGGTGTHADPFLWPQDRVVLSGTVPSAVSYKYNAFWHYPEWGVYVFFPRSTLRPFYIKR